MESDSAPSSLFSNFTLVGNVTDLLTTSLPTANSGVAYNIVKNGTSRTISEIYTTLTLGKQSHHSLGYTVSDKTDTSTYMPVTVSYTSTANVSCVDCGEESEPWLVYSTVWSMCILISTLCVIGLTTFGNVLVIMAFSREKKLRTWSNYYILNLSIADLLVGSFSIPLCVPYVLFGKWVLGPALCKLWVFADYTLCCSSLFSVVLITFDRYCSVTRAIKYRTQNNLKTTIFKMSLAWIIPICFYAPTVFGWDYFTGTSVPDGECVAGFADNFPITLGQTFFEFFFPLLLVFYFNLSIFLNIRKRTRKSMKRTPSATSLPSSAKMSNESESSQTIERNSSFTKEDGKVKLFISNVKEESTSCGDVEIDTEENGGNNNSDDIEQHKALLPKNTLQVPEMYEQIKMNHLNLPPDANNQLIPNHTREFKSCLSPKSRLRNGQDGVRRSSLLSVTISEPMLAKKQECPTVTTTVASDSPAARNSTGRDHMVKLSASSQQAVRRKLSRDKKLAKSLIIIVGAFVLCWTPYQLLNLIQSICIDCVNTYLFDVSFWILWLNSTLNPLLYPFCNIQFKLAFKKILCRKRYKRNRQAYTMRECHSTTITMANRKNFNSETTSGAV
ncbi:histamine H3 receptor-like [Glandiceps talaboti]